MRTYSWHRAGWCENCSLIVCGICSFLEGRKRYVKHDTCPKCGANIEDEKKSKQEEADKVATPMVAPNLKHQSSKVEEQMKLNRNQFEINKFQSRAKSSIEPEIRFFQWLYKYRLFLLAIFFLALLSAIFVEVKESEKVSITIAVITGILFLSSMVESEDMREEKKTERDSKIAKKEMRNKQKHLNMEIERLKNLISKEVESNKPLENILPAVRPTDYEVLAKTISKIDFIKNTDKGLLFKNMNPEFISKVLAYFSEADEINILREIEPEKRNEVLLRYSLSKRAMLESNLKKPNNCPCKNIDNEDDN
jgi:hypothetical protein